MDIIDIVLAKALTPQQLASYIAQAQQATTIATTAANNISAITEQTNENNTNSEAALANVTAALADLSAAADTEIDKLEIEAEITSSSSGVGVDLVVSYPSGKVDTLNDVVKYYKNIGQNEDGTLTQKAITDYFNSVYINMCKDLDYTNNMSFALVNVDSAESFTKQVIDLGETITPAGSITGTMTFTGNHTLISITQTNLSTGEHVYHPYHLKTPLIDGHTYRLIIHAVDNTKNLKNYCYPILTYSADSVTYEETAFQTKDLHVADNGDYYAEFTYSTTDPTFAGKSPSIAYYIDKIYNLEVAFFLQDVTANYTTGLKTYGGGDSSSTNLGPNNSGKVVIVGKDGNIIASDIDADNVIEMLINNDLYTYTNVVGLEIDYANKTFSRLYDAAGLTGGTDFDQFKMYGGRRKCIVNSQGEIVAWEGEVGYTEANDSYQVMVYQPKFYYKRKVINKESDSFGNTIIRKEQILLSDEMKIGFKVHPAFIDPTTQEEKDYILIGAYEGVPILSSAPQDFDYKANDYSTYINSDTDKMGSLAGRRPIKSWGTRTFHPNKCEAMANHISSYFHNTILATYNINQMLALVEYGGFNIQNYVGKGVVSQTAASLICAAITGATASLSTASGVAATGSAAMTEYVTTYGVQTTTTNGQLSAVYRGVENVWGSLWEAISGAQVLGTGKSGSGGRVIVCSDFNYVGITQGNLRVIPENYSDAGFELSSVDNWIPTFGYSNNFDWAFVPVNTNESTGNSVLPVGDRYWHGPNAESQLNKVSYGGAWTHGDNAGLFSCSFDKENQIDSTGTGGRIWTYGAPAIQKTNYQKWQTKVMNNG